jgi:CheY-like chemotaxis protein
VLSSPAFKVLLAEDNADDVLLMRHAFRKAGVPGQLEAVCDGVEAMAYLRGKAEYGDRERFPSADVLLLDLNMPRMNGFEVLQALRGDELFGLLPVFVLSASNLPADILRAHKLGANGYVLKPSRVDELVAFAGALHGWLRFSCWTRLANRPATGHF